MKNRTSVKKDPKQDFNACEDFLITEGLVISAAMKVSGMNSLGDSPDSHVILEDAWLLNDTDRKTLLASLTDKVISQFVDFSFNNPKSPESDLVTEYGIQLLSIGLFYLEY